MTETQRADGILSGLPSTMNDAYQLNTTTLIRHAARTYPEQEIVYRTQDGGWDRYNYAGCYARVVRAANALRHLGVGPGDRVGILDWNSRRHFELYYAIPGIGAVMVQLNLRLGAADLAYVAAQSEVSVVAVDESLLWLAESLAPGLPQVKGWVILTDRPLSEVNTTLAPIYGYEELLAQADDAIDWPVVDETSAYSACYTTGTTGRPKGVYYSHRALYLHSTGVATTLGMSPDDCTMLLTPMFHAQCWGLPQAATLTATRIVLPGKYSIEDAGVIADAMVREGVTVANGAPAVFRPVLEHLRGRAERPDFSRARWLCGSSEPPLSLMREIYELTGAEVVHGYGATETTPLIFANRIKPSLRARLSTEELWDLKRKQGLPLAGVDVLLLDSNDRPLPHDGAAIGELCVRGPWVTAAYHDMPEASDRFHNGFWRTGDLASIDSDGYLKLADRLKDVIKSGGEWISSIDMENALVAHPAVREAAVIGVPDPKWDERPIAMLVLEPGASIGEPEIADFLSDSFARWQLPDTVHVVDEIPKTSVGKIDKKALRAEYGSTGAPSALSEVRPAARQR
jgi:fatty-acyl-CoA synthase